MSTNKRQILISRSAILDGFTSNADPAPLPFQLIFRIGVRATVGDDRYRAEGASDGKDDVAEACRVVQVGHVGGGFCAGFKLTPSATQIVSVQLLLHHSEHTQKKQLFFVQTMLCR